MRRLMWLCGLILVLAFAAGAADIQGTIVDWNCAQDMAHHGRATVLKQKSSCSLTKNYTRDAYGLITDQHKVYQLNDPGNQRILELLKNTPDKDNLKVVVSGDVQDGAIKVNNISML